MKIYLLGLDQNFFHELHEQNYQVKNINSVQQLEETDAILVITDEIIKVYQLEELRKKYPNLDIYYKLKSGSLHTEKTTEKICNLNKIHLLNKFADSKLFLSLIENSKHSLIENNVITFIGSKAGVGVTTVSFEFAKHLIKQGKNVVHVGINVFNEGIKLNSYEPYSLNNIKQKMSGNLFTTEDIKHLPQYQGVKMIVGNEDLFLIDDFTEDEVLNLITFLKEHFDFVILDAGAIPNSAAWYIGLISAKDKYLVINEESMHKAISLLEISKKIGLIPEDFLIIVNDELETETIGSIQNKLKASVVLTIKRSKTSINLDRNQLVKIKTLLE